MIHQQVKRKDLNNHEKEELINHLYLINKNLKEENKNMRNEIKELNLKIERMEKENRELKETQMKMSSNLIVLMISN